METPASRETIAEFTRLLAEIGSGTDRWDDALPLVYSELRRIAARLLERAPGVVTLEPTALAHEAWARLQQREGFTDRSHFLAVAAIAMRGLLVDRARENAAQKRGGGRAQITLTPAVASREAPALDVLDLHQSLEDLAAIDARQARIVELKVFGGLTGDEIAEVLQIAPSTVDAGWRVARAWLRRRLGQGSL